MRLGLKSFGKELRSFPAALALKKNKNKVTLSYHTCFKSNGAQFYNILKSLWFKANTSNLKRYHSYPLMSLNKKSGDLPDFVTPDLCSGYQIGIKVHLVRFHIITNNEL